jgi:CBS-domain-containing membrane protein
MALEPSPKSVPMLTVADVMCADPVRVHEHTSVAEAARLLQRTACSDLMVVDEAERWLGVVSEGDLLRTCLPSYADLGGRSLVEAGDVLLARAARAAGATVAPLVLRNVIRVAPGDALLRAATVMASMQIRRLPVVDAEGILVGSLARADLIAGLVNQASAGEER